MDTAIPLLCKRYAGPHSDHRDKTIGNFIRSEHTLVHIVDTAIPLLRKRYADPHSDHRDKTLWEIIHSEYAIVT